MLWLSPPPYLRRAVAALALVAAVAVDLAGSPSVDHPFVATEVAAGAPVGPSVLEYRSVPAGLLPPVPDPGGFAARDLAPGDPLTPSALSAGTPPPHGWWAIRTGLPAGAGVGARVRLIAVQPRVDVVGIVTSIADDPLPGGEAEGMVAVPPEAAGAVADAAARRALTVLIGT